MYKMRRQVVGIAMDYWQDLWTHEPYVNDSGKSDRHGAGVNFCHVISISNINYKVIPFLFHLEIPIAVLETNERT
jgi:hypothetical protein